ncbi:MAG: hypothetical protein ABIU20_10085 [Blastocatellia bacterium]
MKKKTSAVIAIILVCYSLSVAGFGQDKKQPVTKEEIQAFLKSASSPRPGTNRRIEQGDLAAEIDQRGVAFPVTEQTLEELRKAGARAFVLDAIRNTVKKEEPPRLNEDTPHLKTVEASAQAVAPEPSEEEKEKALAAAFARLPLLEQARYYALEYADDLPDFSATQFVTRYAQKPGDKDWKQEDKLEIELTYRIKGGEKYKLIKLDGKPSTLKYENLDGSTSTGEFGSLLAAAFALQSKAEFKEVRKETFHNRQTLVYDFKVKKAFSANQIIDKSTFQTVTAAYQGTVWIDAETKRVLRIEQAAEGMPANFSITLAENAVEYDWVKIADQPYLLPVRAEVLLGSDRDRSYSRNVIEFRSYRKFDTDIKIVPDK